LPAATSADPADPRHEAGDISTTVRVQSGFPCTPALGVRVASIKDADDLDGDGNVDELPLLPSVGVRFRF
jgi:hypothetical protein